MPEKKTLTRARADRARGKAPSTQAGEFVREEVHHIREGKHGARSTKQAIAIGLSKARRAGVHLSPPQRGKASEETRRGAALDLARGRKSSTKVSARRSRATKKALEQEGRAAAAPRALSRQAHDSAIKRTKGDRSRAAKMAARTKGAKVRSRAASKGARTRAGR